MITIKAPAKINIYLAVKDLLPNGLHEVISIMQTIDLFDELSIDQSDTVKVNCDYDELEGAANLAHKAATLLQSKFKITAGAHITLKKNIPVAAGLGGGSSDAAQTLIGLNELWSLGLTFSELEKIGSLLGSDVPFFIRGGTQLVRGYGQDLVELDDIDLGNTFFVLGNPGINVRTASVYKKFDELEKKQSPDESDAVNALRLGSPDKVAKRLYNDLERAASLLCPKIDKLKEIALENDAKRVLVSGSGPTVFALCGDIGSAKKVAEAFSKEASFSKISRAVSTTVREKA